MSLNCFQLWHMLPFKRLNLVRKFSVSVFKTYKGHVLAIDKMLTFLFSASSN